MTEPAKSTPSDSPKQSMQRSGGTRVLLPAATVTTLVTVIAFILAAYSKDLASQKMNEIGDAVAGFASFLAFLWLIVTVVLQYTELQLQRQEIADLRAASEDQAKTLRMTNRVHTLALIRTRQEDALAYLKEGAKTNAQIVANFLDEHLGFQHSNEFLARPEAGIPYILGYFLLEERIDAQATVRQAIVDDALRRDFEYESLVKLDSILRNMENMWDVLKPIWLLSEQADAKEEYIAWETSVGIAWYKDFYQILWPLVDQLRSIVGAGHVGSKLQQIIAKEVRQSTIETGSAAGRAFGYARSQQVPAEPLTGV